LALGPMSPSPADRAPISAWQETDGAAWDAFVEQADHRAFPQLWSWGELRSEAGWQPLRLAVGPSRDRPRAGVQLLLRRLPLGGWSLAYAPRGPIGHMGAPEVREALLTALRELAAERRIGRMRADPETAADEDYGTSLLGAPWRPAPKVQPPTTRLIDLTTPEEELWSSLARKHRQYVSKARREGVIIEQVDPQADVPTTDRALAEFDRIYRLTGERAGFAVRIPAYYQRLWATFGATNRARLFFAVRDGERVATLFHMICGDKAAEVYGGMTEAGATSRANYLLKWEAIRVMQADGLRTYDMWGLATGGIRKFKEGFGGTEVTWVGARDISLSGIGDAVIGIALVAHETRQRLRSIGSSRPSPAATPSD
jgi:lipid II:glycine glycyltransferase (peptidoglycan interpeptide bridge formation enzyme)